MVLQLVLFWIQPSLVSYLFLLLKWKRRAIKITMPNITPPTEAPVMMAYIGFGSSSLSSVVSAVVEIKGWTLKMVPPTDLPILG